MSEFICYDRNANEYLYVTPMGNGFSVYNAMTRDWRYDTNKNPKDIFEYIDPESFNYSRYLQAQIDYLMTFIVMRLG